jgi:hypothetical protein
MNSLRMESARNRIAEDSAGSRRIPDTSVAPRAVAHHSAAARVCAGTRGMTARRPTRLLQVRVPGRDELVEADVDILRQWPCHLVLVFRKGG